MIEDYYTLTEHDYYLTTVVYIYSNRIVTTLIYMYFNKTVKLKHNLSIMHSIIGKNKHNRLVPNNRFAFILYNHTIHGESGRLPSPKLKQSFYNIICQLIIA